MRWLWSVFFALAASFAAAQPHSRYFDCVDTLVLNGEYVFVGRILSVHPERAASAGTNVTMAVRERLKGEVSDVTQAGIVASASELEAWRAKGTPLLVVDGGKAIDLSSPPRLVAADLRPLKSEAEALSAARRAVLTHPGVLRIATFSRDLGGMDRALVPADAALERWAESTLADAGEKVLTRAEAAQALRRFPSRAHVALLKGLLRDEGTVLTITDAGPDRPVEVYLVRRRAFEALQAWGEKVEEPIAERKPNRSPRR